MSPGPGERRPAARRLPPRGVQRRRRRLDAQDPPRQRRPHLPPRLKRPTETQPVCFRWPVASSEADRTGAPVGHHCRAAVDRAQLLEPQLHRHPGVQLGRAWHLADEVGARRVVEVDQHHRVRRRDTPGAPDGPRRSTSSSVALPPTGCQRPFQLPQWRQYIAGHVQDGVAVVASAEDELTPAAASKKPPVSRSSSTGSRRCGESSLIDQRQPFRRIRPLPGGSGVDVTRQTSASATCDVDVPRIWRTPSRTWLRPWM